MATYVFHTSFQCFFPQIVPRGPITRIEMQCYKKMFDIALGCVGYILVDGNVFKYKTTKTHRKTLNRWQKGDCQYSLEWIWWPRKCFSHSLFVIFKSHSKIETMILWFLRTIKWIESEWETKVVWHEWRLMNSHYEHHHRHSDNDNYARDFMW